METEVLLGLPERLKRLVVDVVGEMVGFAGAWIELVVVMEILHKTRSANQNAEINVGGPEQKLLGMVIFLQNLLGSVSVVNIWREMLLQRLPISTIAIFFTSSGYLSRAWNAAIITLLNTQNPHDDAVVSRPSVPA